MTVHLLVTPAGPIMPTVESVFLGGGHAQRSSLDSATLTFNTLVNVDQSSADPFRFINTSTGVEVIDIPSVSIIGAKTVVGFSFLPGGSVDATGSLADGNYQLTVDAALVSAAGMALDGNRDGSDGDPYVFGDEEADAFFRFFGDSDGDRDVDAQDYGRFGLSFLKSQDDIGFDASFDSDGDGDIDGQDYGRFAKNFLHRM